MRKRFGFPLLALDAMLCGSLPRTQRWGDPNSHSSCAFARARGAQHKQKPQPFGWGF
jgi:hypothetical protein